MWCFTKGDQGILGFENLFIRIWTESFPFCFVTKGACFDCVSFNIVQDKNVKFDTEAPEHQEDQRHCPVMELKDVHEGKKDEACGKDVIAGHAGLCG